jgi:hypothetical protein
MPRYFLHIHTQDDEQYDREGVEVMDLKRRATKR